MMAKRARRDAGLRAAIRASVSIGALARSLGLSQPTVSGWRRVPPHHVIGVERLTGVSRRILRPDLYDVPEPSAPRLKAPRRTMVARPCDRGRRRSQPRS